MLSSCPADVVILISLKTFLVEGRIYRSSGTSSKDCSVTVALFTPALWWIERFATFGAASAAGLAFLRVNTSIREKYKMKKAL